MMNAFKRQYTFSISTGLSLVVLMVACAGAVAEEWRYDVLAYDKKIKAEAITGGGYDELLEFKSIDTDGFKTARLYVQVMQSDFQKNPGKFTSSAKLRVSCFHNYKKASSHYFEKEIPMTVTTGIGGWVEIPIIGPDLRIVITGDKFPKTELKADTTIYLLK